MQTGTARTGTAIYSARRELMQAWGSWLSSKWDWDWFVTLTFRDPATDNPYWTKIGWAYAKNAWRGFVRALGQQAGEIYWFRATEFQRWRGVPHFHALVGGVGKLRRDEAWSWWFERYGFARILPYDPTKGAGYYLCKYVTKELGDIEFSKNAEKFLKKGLDIREQSAMLSTQIGEKNGCCL